MDEFDKDELTVDVIKSELDRMMSQVDSDAVSEEEKAAFGRVVSNMMQYRMAIAGQTMAEFHLAKGQDEFKHIHDLLKMLTEFSFTTLKGQFEALWEVHEKANQNRSKE